MILRQLTHDDLGCASYLIGDDDAGVAAVVDPKLHIDEDRFPLGTVQRMTVPELHERCEGGRDGLQVLDVRERIEWDAGHIPGSLHVPDHDIHALPGGIDRGRPIAAICGSGQRSAVAASLLQRYGAGDVIHVVEEGVGTWQRSGWPIER